MPVFDTEVTDQWPPSKTTSEGSKIKPYESRTYDLFTGSLYLLPLRVKLIYLYKID